MASSDRPHIIGRGAQISPANRFQSIHVEEVFDHVEHDADYLQERQRRGTEYYIDDAQSIVVENDSPDIPFRYSLNAYRGCSHGCAYCYARPTHEYLGLSAGLDFETKIFIKPRAAELLVEFLARPRWQVQPIMMSGVTDCYQPAEKQFRLTRQCLEVAHAARQPIMIVTKNAWITRDLDILASMARQRLVTVAISLTSLDQSLTRVLEPRTSAPLARLRAIAELSRAGVPVAVMIAPLIPGLNDEELGPILAAASEHGAQSASYTLVRLPLTVRPIFLDWLEQYAPTKRERVEQRIRDMRQGALNDAQFGSRMRGSGFMSEQIQQLFGLLIKKFGLHRPLPDLECSNFVPPVKAGGQMVLF